MNKAFAVIVGLVVLALLLLFSSTFTVKYNEIAIQSKFGRVDASSVLDDPGLNVKLPIFHKVVSLDRRLQLVESPLEEITTADGLQVVVKAYMLWRIDAEDDGALRFFESFTTTDGAATEIRGRFRTAFTGVLAEYRFEELLGETSRLVDAETRILDAVRTELSGDGVLPVDVGISQLVLPSKAAKEVVDRMKQTRQAQAKAETTRGQAQSESIIAEANTRVEEINAFTTLFVSEIEADAEIQAATYMGQLAEDKELAIFLEWLDAFQSSLSQYTSVVLPAQTAPFHLINMRPLADGERIPYPPTMTTPAESSLGMDSSTDDASDDETTRGGS